MLRLLRKQTADKDQNDFNEQKDIRSQDTQGGHKNPADLGED